MKIYTKTGDKGKTSLIGGKIVSKNHKRIEAYGTVDELIAFVGLVRDHITSEDLQKKMIRIQDDLMICAAILASDCENCELKIPKLSENNIVWLETEIDTMETVLPRLSKFVLPGGHPAVSFCHVARTVCRRAERTILAIEDIQNVPSEVFRYMNRLSDYLFVFSRLLTIEYQAIEITWQPLLD